MHVIKRTRFSDSQEVKLRDLSKIPYYDTCLLNLGCIMRRCGSDAKQFWKVSISAAASATGPILRAHICNLYGCPTCSLQLKTCGSHVEHLAQITVPSKFTTANTLHCQNEDEKQSTLRPVIETFLPNQSTITLIVQFTELSHQAPNTTHHGSPHCFGACW